MPRRYYSSTAQRTTITSSLTAAATTIPIAAAVGLPSTYPYTMILDPDTGSEEAVEVTNRVSLNLTVTRGVDGTTAVIHNSGAFIQHGFTARDFDEPNAFLNAGGTVGGPVTVQGGTGQDATPELKVLGVNGYVDIHNSMGAGSYNGLTAAGDKGIIFTNGSTETGAFVIGPWSASAYGIRIAPNNNTIGGNTTFSTGSVSFNTILEKANIVAASTTGTIAFDALTAGIWYYTTASTSAFTLNFRGSSTVSMNTMLAVGQSISLVFLNTTGAATTSYPSAWQIDGAAQTPKYQYGNVISAGNASSIDAYTVNILKTAATPTYTMFVGQTRWA